ncbi:MAG: hypothetical protein RSD52_09635 [Oscillospiraceae bacterium]
MKDFDNGCHFGKTNSKKTDIVADKRKALSKFEPQRKKRILNTKASSRRIEAAIGGFFM